MVVCSKDFTKRERDILIFYLKNRVETRKNANCKQH